MVVFDASTLILLAKIEILREVLLKVDSVIPKIIEKEATHRSDRPDAQLIRQCIREGAIRVHDSKAVRKTDLARLTQDFHLSEGEATALLLARKWGAVLATDDGPAIKASKILGVSFVTSANLLVHAALKGWVPKSVALVKLESLSRAGRYESRIVEDARRKIQGG